MTQPHACPPQMLEELKRRGGYQAEIEADVAELAADIRQAAPHVASAQLASVHAMLNFMAPVEALLKRIRSDEGAVFRKMKVGPQEPQTLSPACTASRHGVVTRPGMSVRV